MKKLTVFLIMMLFCGAVVAQNSFKYEIKAKGGISVGVDETKLDSIVWNNTTKQFTMYKGSDTAHVYVPVAGQIDGSTIYIDEADSSAVSAPNSYATGKMLYDHNVYDPTIEVYKLIGSPIKAMTLGYHISDMTSDKALEDGMQNMIAVYLPQAATITGVKFVLATAGNFTNDAYNGVGLYSANIGTGALTLVASCADDHTIWEATANTVVTKAFATPYAASAGLYYVALLYNESAHVTVPRIQAAVAPLSIMSKWDFPNSLFIHAVVYGKAAFTTPNAASDFSGEQGRPFVVLY